MVPTHRAHSRHEKNCDQTFGPGTTGADFGASSFFGCGSCAAGGRLRLDHFHRRVRLHGLRRSVLLGNRLRFRGRGACRRQGVGGRATPRAARLVADGHRDHPADFVGDLPRHALGNEPRARHGHRFADAARNAPLDGVRFLRGTQTGTLQVRTSCTILQVVTGTCRERSSQIMRQV